MSLIKQSDNYSANFGEVLRSSSIFYVVQNSKLRTTISLSNYWQFKNDLEVTILASWRSMKGQLLKRQKIELHSVLNLSCPFDDFEGSCEIETFCLKNMRIPYSAIMVIYEAVESITMVHSYTRTYSNHEIEEARTITDGHESCWTVYSGDIDSFAIGHNGFIAMPEQSCRIRVRRYDGKEIDQEFTLHKLNPYETFKIVPSQIISELDDFLDGKPGNARLDFNLNSSFTRLLCCNQLSDHSCFQVTHSNFDYSQHFTDFVDSDNSTAYMVIPPYVPSLDRVNYEVVIYPDRDPGAYLIGTQEADLERDIDSFALKPTSSSLTLLFRRLDNKLPSRIVTGLRILQPNLSAECSLGVIHHNRPKKHFHWMLVSGSLDTYILFTKVIEIYGSLPVDFKLSLTLYSEHTRAPLKADFGSELLNMAQDRAIPLGLLFEDCKNHLGSNFGYLTVWSNYPGLVMYSALKKNDSITLEHSF